jgi:type II secretory pathway pseudopilin PulG
LIEMLVVTALLAAVAAGAVVSLAAPYRNARADHERDRLIHWLQLVRSHASRHGATGALVIDLNEQSLRFDRDSSSESHRKLELASVLRIEEILLPDKRRDDREVRIFVTSDGMTESFALRFSGLQGAPNCMLLAGGSGQVAFLTKEEVTDVLELLAQGIHAR